MGPKSKSKENKPAKNLQINKKLALAAKNTQNISSYFPVKNFINISTKSEKFDSAKTIDIPPVDTRNYPIEKFPEKINLNTKTVFDQSAIKNTTKVTITNQVLSRVAYSNSPNTALYSLKKDNLSKPDVMGIHILEPTKFDNNFKISKFPTTTLSTSSIKQNQKLPSLISIPKLNISKSNLLSQQLLRSYASLHIYLSSFCYSGTPAALHNTFPAFEDFETLDSDMDLEQKPSDRSLAESSQSIQNSLISTPKKKFQPPQSPPKSVDTTPVRQSSFVSRGGSAMSQRTRGLMLSMGNSPTLEFAGIAKISPSSRILSGEIGTPTRVSSKRIVGNSDGKNTMSVNEQQGEWSLSSPDFKFDEFDFADLDALLDRETTMSFVDPSSNINLKHKIVSSNDPDISVIKIPTANVNEEKTNERLKKQEKTQKMEACPFCEFAFQKLTQGAIADHLEEVFT
ncbi:hypothetical protein HK096_004348 [Nowakowskiella sp. JEL0078]|nr:hypothetical protein HK096_004348 [Nowakowskiella sp. JEL0078]